MTKLRICSPHCGVSPETTSGGETYERELLTRLGRDGVRLEIILARGKPYPIDVPNWTVHRFPVNRGLRWWLAPFIVPPAIRQVHKTVGFDLLRVHSLRFMGPAALWARWHGRIDVPIVAHHHHLDPNRLNGVIEKRVIDSCDNVIVGSVFARRQLAEALGARTDHITVVPYGIDSRFAPRPPRADLQQRYRLGGGPVVLYLGGLKVRKNVHIMIDIWADIVRAWPTALLMVAGDGPLLGAVRRHVTAARLEQHVVFTGYVRETEKADHFNLADVFLFPSALEGFGLAVGEAMSSGLPVVASDRGSIPELLVHGEGGFLCDPERPVQFVEAVLRLLADRPLRVKQAAANVQRVDSLFRWPRCVDATRKTYEDAVEAWRRCRGYRR